MRSKNQLHLRESLFCALVAIVLCCLVGCGKVARCSVSGKVSFRGKAIEDGGIRFVPTAGTPGPGGSAKIAAGQYSILQKDGMLAGKYQVMVSATRPATQAEIARMDKGTRDPGEDLDEDAPRGPDGVPILQYIPEEFNLGTKLTADLAAGENTKDFSL